MNGQFIYFFLNEIISIFPNLFLPLCKSVSVTAIGAITLYKHNSSVSPQAWMLKLEVELIKKINMSVRAGLSGFSPITS